MDSGSLAGKRAERASNVSQKTRHVARLAQIAFGFAQAKLSRGNKRFLRRTNCYSLVPVARPPHAGKRWRRANTGCVHPPQTAPGLGPPCPWNGAWIQLYLLKRRMKDEYLNRPCCNSVWWGPTEQGRPGKGATLYCFNPAPCELSCERACERARLSRVSSRRVSGKRSGA